MYFDSKLFLPGCNNFHLCLQKASLFFRNVSSTHSSEFTNWQPFPAQCHYFFVLSDRSPILNSTRIRHDSQGRIFKQRSVWQDISNSYSRYSRSASFELFCGILFSILLIYKNSMRSFVSNTEREHLFNALLAIKFFIEEKWVESTSCF